MTKRWKKHMAWILSFSMLVITFSQSGNIMEVYGQGKEVFTYAELSEEIARCSKGENVEIVLGADITGVSGTINITGGELSIDLNGHTLSGSSGNFLLNASNKSLRISDEGSDAAGNKGSVINTHAAGGIITKTGGTLSISGGVYKGLKECIFLSGSEAEISGGEYSSTAKENGVALRMNQSATAHIYGKDTVFSSYDSTLWLMDSAGSTLTIDDGTFIQNDNSTWGFVCYAVGNNTVNIHGGTFNLNTAAGKSLFAGADTTVEITGGTFNGGIGRGVKEESDLNYTAFYGDEQGNNRMIKEGFVLTDNTIYSEPGNTAFTVPSVSVVQGSLIRMDTRKSCIETYDDAGSAQKADLYLVLPISVGADGTVYQNTAGESLPVIDGERVNDDNKYTFSGWYDEKGVAYSSADAYIKSAGSGMKDTMLTAGYNADVSTFSGLESAMTNSEAVSNIVLLDDVYMENSMRMKQAFLNTNKTLDLGGRTIRYDNASETDTPALTLDGSWTVKNGNILAADNGCIRSYGTVVIDNLYCTAENAPYVLDINNISDQSANSIRSGVFETTLKSGTALRLSGGETAVTDTQVQNLFTGAYASSTNTKQVGDYVYLDSLKLKVLESPVTYPGDGADVDMGTYTYGDEIPSVEDYISNRDNTGDIVITGVSVDNSAFVVTPDVEQMSIFAGASDVYKYKISLKDKIDAGTYAATISVQYTRMDGTTGVSRQKVSLNVKKAPGAATVSMADHYVGQSVSPVVKSVTNKDSRVTYFYKKSNEGDEAYSKNMPEDEGVYTVKAVVDGNNNFGEVVATAEYKISYIDTPEKAYTLAGKESTGGWFTSSVTIYPAEGYRIADTAEGEYTESITVNRSCEPVIYLRNSDNARTRAISVKKINIDDQLPVINGITTEDVYYNDALYVTISDENLESITLNGSVVSFEKNSVSLLLKPSLDKYSLTVMDKAGNVVRKSFTVEEAWMKEGIVSSGIKKLRQKKSYKLGTGKWKVSGDNTVYNGGTSIYVNGDGDYNFLKE